LIGLEARTFADGMPLGVGNEISEFMILGETILENLGLENAKVSGEK